MFLLESGVFMYYVCKGFSGVGTYRCVPIRKVSSFQRVLCTGFNGRCVPIVL